MVQRGRQRRRGRVEGSGSTDVAGLEGAPPALRHVWLSRVLNGNEEKVKEHMESRNVQVKEITKVSHSDAKFSSFKISVSKEVISKVLDSDFWPKGMACKIWRIRNVQDGEYENDNHSFTPHDEGANASEEHY